MTAESERMKSIDGFAREWIEHDNSVRAHLVPSTSVIISREYLALRTRVTALKTERDELARFLHARAMHPQFEYAMTDGPRKNFDANPPDGDGWECNVEVGHDGWERFEYHEEAYWRRRKGKPNE